MEAFEATKRKAAAKAGMVAPSPVTIEPFLTGLGPESTAFFQALHIDTKINKNKIEIIHKVELIKEGEIVTPNQATLLQKIEMVPFFYQVLVNVVYDNGNIFDAEVLSIDDEKMQQIWTEGFNKFLGLALATDFPCVPCVPHVMVNSIKEMLGFGVAAGIADIPEVKKIAD